MKERIILLSLIGLLIIAFIGVIYTQKDRGNEQSTYDGTTFEYLPKLNQQSFENKLNNGESFAVYIWRPDCGDSVQFNKEFRNYFVDLDEFNQFKRLKYDLSNGFYSFDISTIIPDIKDREDRENKQEQYGFYYTPSLVYYEDLDNDGISDVKNIAEWDPTWGFVFTDYLKWFYDNDLITPIEEVYHTGESDQGKE